MRVKKDGSAELADFSRDELHKIQERAAGLARGAGNPAWQRAYLALADAADRLDAMVARSTELKCACRDETVRER